MDIHEINAILEARGMTGQDLAAQLGVAYEGFRHVLTGRRPLTEQLARHISYVLEAPQNALLIYKVDLTSQHVADLTARQQFPAGEAGDRQRAIAVQAVLEHNMRTLAELGRKVELPSEMRGLLAVLEQTHWADDQQPEGPTLEAAEEDPPRSDQ